MRLPITSLVLLISISTLGQGKYIGKYEDRFSESIELNPDSTFIHTYRFDLASSWTIGNWSVKNDTILLKTKIVEDTLEIRNSDGKVVKDSLVISTDKKIDRISQNEYLGALISSGGQNRVEAPAKLYWKGKKLFRINENGTLDLKRVKGFWSKRRYRTFFRKKKD